MKYTLINCYSDNNKGDLGIILSTIDFLKETDKNAEIIGVSTYNKSDPYFETEHEILKTNIPMFPAIFGELNIGSSKNAVLKMLRFAFDTLRILLLMILPQRIGLSILFSKAEKRSIDEIKSSDYVVSKGGSFLCNEKDLRSKIALIRFLYIFFLCIKMKKKVVILCQSLGPVYGKFSRYLLNKILVRCDAVVLREDFCIKKYNYLTLPKERVYYLNDIAFFFEPTPFNCSFLLSDRFRVGMTVKHVSADKDFKFQQMMLNSIMYCIDAYNCDIFIFPHVTIDNDLHAAYEIYNKLPDKYKPFVTVFSDNYEGGELKYMYKQMDMFIGTRLHSTIFAMGVYVPCVCISYHGTKSQGIFNNLDSLKYVVEEYDDVVLNMTIDLLYKNRDEQRKVLETSLMLQKQLFEVTFKEVFR
ncbi:polysaccharide pyruvyl transferase family protein [Dysgonomonas macrotermitis]|uniref:Polysaccharide pyruvyl transferase family protein WcaK n=1 Tax=Dysgonomonas macrotermitis TaxID=1346286 RepID=A0A1M5I3Q8_9BACT|nr:polysaccharide pyruvyl transferase family protein [Dysgonomonas macrotermitis]SHG22968.1 Polysaccharide pyruvyl transferase family protein WcaK [Dysgonomonas macrotermitis]